MTDKDLLLEFLIETAQLIRERTPQASGRTINKIQSEMFDTAEGFGGRITAPSWFTVRETGRRPYSPSGSKVSLDFVEAIQEWINSKSLQNTLNAWAVAKSIQLKGDKLFQGGGHSGVITDAINKERIENFKLKLTEKYLVDVKATLNNKGLQKL